MFQVNHTSISPVLCLVGVLALGGVCSAAEATENRAYTRIEAVRTLLDGAEPRSGAITLDMPSITQEGSSVPIGVVVSRPMRTENHVEALYLFASRNPSPELAEFYFTPLAGEARVSTRIRLDSTQTVWVFARTSDGAWWVASQEVRVAVSGCMSRDDTYRSEDVMNARVRGPDRLRAGQVGDVRTLINHPMETGLRKQRDGTVIPQRIIHTFEATLDDEPVLKARLHRAMAANPYILFPVAPTRSGALALVWEDDTGARTEESVAITVR